MRHSNVSDNQGFTVLEALIVAVFAGILAAMAGPSYFSWSQRRAVDSAITSIEGAIKEAQRQAMARSRYCPMTFNSTTITSTDNCLLTGDRTLSNVSLETSASEFNFDYLGRTFDNSSPPVELTNNVVFVVTHSQNANLKRCLVLSTPLGLIGTGKYTGTGTTEANCTP
jgi:type II secretory pathway pseudopilin PulG